MTKKSPPSLTALCIVCAAAVAAAIVSCSPEPQTYRLHVNFGSPGVVSTYKFHGDEVGKIYKDGELSRDFDMKIEGDIIYKVKDTLPGGGAVVIEKNIWSWDEPAKDSGQVKRATKEYTYELQMHPTGKVMDLKMLDKPSDQWEEYVRAYARQANPIFPEEKIAPGYSWLQTVPVELPDGAVDTSDLRLTFKGTARKNGYNCAIIEFKGNVILPIFLNPEDTMQLVGVDRIEVNGITYQAIDKGMIVTSDERRRTIRDRNFLEGGEPVSRRSEIESVIKIELISIEGNEGG